MLALAVNAVAEAALKVWPAWAAPVHWIWRALIGSVPPAVPTILAGDVTEICPLPLLYVVRTEPVTFAEAELLSAARLVVALSVIFAHVKVEVLSEMLAVDFFVMLTPKFTVLAEATAAQEQPAISIAKAKRANRKGFVI